MNHILVVDDEPDIRSTLEAILAEEGYTVTTAGSAAEGLDLIRDAIFDAVLLDIWLPDRDGLEVLQQIRKFDAVAGPEVIIISGHGTIESAVRATKLGAFDFLEKPLSLERTLILLKNAIEARRLRAENEEWKRQLSPRAHISGESVPIKALRQQIKLMAPTNGRVLIFGESGSGKEIIAREIYAESLRREGVFIELNCAAIPEDSIEIQLFGYRHSAVPGGPPEKRGTLERANNGTLFLDEIGHALATRHGRAAIHSGGHLTTGERGCPDHRRNQQKSRRRDRPRQFPRRSLLPAQRHSVLRSAVARSS